MNSWKDIFYIKAINIHEERISVNTNGRYITTRWFLINRETGEVHTKDYKSQGSAQIAAAAIFRSIQRSIERALLGAD